MEYINKIEIQGRVCSITFTDIQNKQVAKFSIITEYVHKVGSIPVVETTWFACTAFEGEGINFSIIQVGNTLNVTGRVRESRYVDSQGVEKRFFEVICKTVKLAE